MKKEIENRESILSWLKEHNLREFTFVADMVSSYTDTPEDAMEEIKHPPKERIKDARNSTLLSETTNNG